MIKLSLHITLLLAVAAVAHAGPIYVFKEPDGTIRFTDKQPPEGVKTEIFTGKGTGFTFSKGRSPAWKRWNPKHLYSKEYEKIIDTAAVTNRLDPHLIRAMIHVESAFNPRAVSSKGARGLMQLMPGTARDLGVRNAFDPSQNIHGGTKYLRYLLGRFSGDLRLALAAYNAGEQNVTKYRGIPPFSETRAYVQRVLLMKTRYQAAVARG